MSDQRTPAACLEVSRNGRLCAGAKHLYGEIERLQARVETLEGALTQIADIADSALAATEQEGE